MKYIIIFLLFFTSFNLFGQTVITDEKIIFYTSFNCDSTNIKKEYPVKSYKMFKDTNKKIWVFLLHINDSMSYLFKSKLSIDNSKLLAAIRLKNGLYTESQKLIIHSPYNKIYINEYR